MNFPEGYFENEVREGFFVPSMIKRSWAAELDVLAQIDRICRKYNIQYFAEWGTLLGAVRHNGFIPWDDDLDIGMKREDYEKFLEVAERELPQGYRINNCRSRDDFWLFLARVMNTSHISFDDEHLRSSHEFPYIAGVDIFIMDYVSRDEEAEHNRDVIADYTITLADHIYERKVGSKEALAGLGKIKSLAEEVFRTASSNNVNAELENAAQEHLIDGSNSTGGAGVIPERKSNGKLVEELHYDVHKIRRYLDASCEDSKLTEYIASLHKDMYMYAEKLFSIFGKDDADELTQLFPFGLRRKGHRYPKEYYADCIRLPFENTTIPVPIGYDAMLRRRYGDYMKICRNRSGHDYPFFESQQAQLDGITGVKLPSYSFTKAEKAYAEAGTEPEKSYSKDSFKALACDAYEELKRYDEPSQAQLLAIDFGTMIEKLYGEGHDTVKQLEKYCEQLYIYVCTGDGREILEKIIDELGESIRKHILDAQESTFIVTKVSEWRYIKTEYEKNVQAGNRVYVIPVPYYHKKFDGALYDMNCEYDAFCELLKNEPDNVHVQAFDEYDIVLHHPDKVYIQNPYDGWDKGISIHPQYYTENIVGSCGSMIYIPPFEVYEFDENDYCQCHNADSYILTPGVVRSACVLVQSDRIRNVYIDKLAKWAGEETRAIWERKILGCGTQMADGKKIDRQSITKTVADMVKSDVQGEKEAGKKILLYHNEASFFIENKEKALDKVEHNVEVFEQNSDSIAVIWNLPESIDDILKKYLTDEAARFISLKKRIENIGQLDTSDGKGIVDYVDAYYGDGSCLSRLCQLAGKPVMLEDVDVI